MKKIILFILPLTLIAAVFFGVTFFLNTNTGKGALQVTANPKSNVYLNGKNIGQTPLCKCEASDMLQQGTYTLRVEPLDAAFFPFEEKIAISSSVLTVVDRTFGKSATSDGSIITLTPIANKKTTELLVVSFPSNVEVFVDSNLSGTTPVLLRDVTVSDHEVKLTKIGYREKSVRIRTVEGYKLSITAFLGIDEGQALLEQSASPSAQLSPSAETSPTPVVAKVTILQTPTGFLRVRADNSIGSAEIARVKPGETYELISETTGWFEIKLADGTTGWISAQYASKQ